MGNMRSIATFFAILLVLGLNSYGWATSVKDEHTQVMKYKKHFINETFQPSNTKDSHISASGDGWLTLRKLLVGPEESPAYVKQLFSLASEGNAEAQFELGQRYLWGDGVKKDEMKAYEWNRQAAVNGESGAMLNLAVYYKTGKVVEKSIQKAINWYQKSGDSGTASAYHHLGDIYLDGTDVPADIHKALEWYIKAAESGDVAMMVKLAQGYSESGVLNRDAELARHWYVEAAKKGDSEGQYQLGKRMKEQNSSELFTVNWLEKAARQGHSSAQWELSMMAHNGSALANLAKGNLLYEGKVVPQEYSAAASWFKIAAKLGNSVAQYRLGQMYKNGWGVPKDQVKAFIWFSLAADDEVIGAAKSRDSLAKIMSPNLVTEAQQQYKNWEPKKFPYNFRRSVRAFSQKLFAVLFILTPFIVIPLAFRSNRKFQSANVKNEPYKYGFWLAYLYIGWAIVVSMLLSEIYYATYRPDIYSLVVPMVVPLLVGAVGILVSKRTRFGWVVATLLSMNPITWVINYFYGKKRWSELAKKNDQAAA